MTHISYKLYNYTCVITRVNCSTVLTVNDTITVALSGSDAIKESRVIQGAGGTV